MGVLRADAARQAQTTPIAAAKTKEKNMKTEAQHVGHVPVITRQRRSKKDTRTVEWVVDPPLNKKTMPKTLAIITAEKGPTAHQAQKAPVRKEGEEMIVDARVKTPAKISVRWVRETTTATTFVVLQEPTSAKEVIQSVMGESTTRRAFSFPQ